MADPALEAALCQAMQTIHGIIGRALTAGVVLDTWMNGQAEEEISGEADGILEAEAARWTQQALAQQALFPSRPMPAAYVESVFADLLTGTALYAAQQRLGMRRVGRPDAEAAAARFRRWITGEPAGLRAAGWYYGVITCHEDFNALAYFGRMREQDFLLGVAHRPWSDRTLAPALAVYLEAGWVRRFSDGSGDWVELTPDGRTVLNRLRAALEAAGEFAWRANAQRWVIFGETDYDRVFHAVNPDVQAVTRQALDQLVLPPGARVLEVGAGTGRVTFDAGLAERVAAAGGELVALEPSAALLAALGAKRAARGAGRVRLVQGVAEALPFPPGRFDVVIAVLVLHWTDAPRAVAEMARVLRPGGQLLTGNSDGSNNFLQIPMVAAWFRPLIQLAAQLGVAPGERQGLPLAEVETLYRQAGLVEVRSRRWQVRTVASDPEAFLTFVLKGAAFFQNILARLPYRERWKLLDRLAREGPQWVAHTSPEEQRAPMQGYVTIGRKPRS
ncbi:Methyltransferase type 11 [Candidatus Hydrogenisulfobacillus filiaventi]|uniref:Methyltransferase type 11 n=1 Tax=Candidatus Hydrogenisulfobacillus filiaventi TaxID=2707344 RepID=A0A6F8ZJ98_9FIRM|nr:methyltransferase domain-containing protein [Bacillota bacterium]CAB1129805.1 Methyltransferase type 11 [Candidatus Hydrogenisulfobacillus filiaventi]